MPANNCWFINYYPNVNARWLYIFIFIGLFRRLFLFYLLDQIPAVCFFMIYESQHYAAVFYLDFPFVLVIRFHIISCLVQFNGFLFVPSCSLEIPGTQFCFLSLGNQCVMGFQVSIISIFLVFSFHLFIVLVLDLCSIVLVS